MVDAYVEECKTNAAPITITGMTLALGLSDKTSFYDYEKYEGFSHCVKRAKTFVEFGHERRLFESACTGSIFALKNMGWKDKTEQEITGKDGKDLIPEIDETEAARRIAFTLIKGASKDGAS